MAAPAASRARLAAIVLAGVLVHGSIAGCGGIESEQRGSRSCVVGYSACLDPNASDYDCAGGSGDRPKYTGFTQVTGSDPFDLDHDGDGVGCE